MDSESYRKAREYAKNKYSAAVIYIQEQCAKELSQVRANLPRGGEQHHAAAQIWVKKIELCVQAQVDALLDAYELYGVAINDSIAQEIISEAQQLCSTLVTRAREAAAQGMSDIGRGGEGILFRELETVSVPVNAIRCQIEERRMRPKMTKPNTVTNIYHLTGANVRVNVNSSDQSVNIVNATSEQIFAELRAQLKEHVPPVEQAEILSRLDELEKAQSSPSFGQKYADFIALAANHITVLAPFIPALTEMLRKTLG
jgi:hypothetical protein